MPKIKEQPQEQENQGPIEIAVVGDLNDTAKTRGVQSELEIVQTAIDTYNTQDVTVDGAPAIGARAAAAVITSADADAPFAKYLKRDTKYTFTWGADGAGLDSPDMP